LNYIINSVVQFDFNQNRISDLAVNPGLIILGIIIGIISQFKRSVNLQTFFYFSNKSDHNLSKGNNE